MPLTSISPYFIKITQLFYLFVHEEQILITENVGHCLSSIPTIK
jgi:hypothetical protein